MSPHVDIVSAGAGFRKPRRGELVGGRGGGGGSILGNLGRGGLLATSGRLLATGSLPLPGRRTSRDRVVQETRDEGGHSEPARLPARLHVVGQLGIVQGLDGGDSGERKLVQAGAGLRANREGGRAARGTLRGSLGGGSGVLAGFLGSHVVLLVWVAGPRSPLERLQYSLSGQGVNTFPKIRFQRAECPASPR